MADLLLVVDRAPRPGPWPPEWLDLALGAIGMEHRVRVLFMGPAVTHLRPPPGTAVEDPLKALATMELFGVDRLLADADALDRHRIDAPRLEVERLDPAALRGTLTWAEVLL